MTKKQAPRHYVDANEFKRAIRKHAPLKDLAESAGVSYNTIRHALGQFNNDQRESLETMQIGTYMAICRAMKVSPSKFIKIDKTE